MNKILFSLALSSFLVACSNTPMTDEQSGAKVEDRTPGNRPAQTSPVDSKATTVDPLKDPRNILFQRSVFFDFDSFIVKEEYKALVQAHAKYLTTKPDAKILVQGNTDERGGREYNLALGQKRADAVKKMMTLLGVKESQIESVSLGEEKPKATGHDEAAWAENRRSDILHAGEF